MRTVLFFTMICLGWPADGWGQLNPRGTAAGTGEFPVTPLREPPKVVWETRPGFRDFGAMAMSGGVVVTGNTTGTGGVFGFDAATGKLLWGTRGKQMKGTPAVDAQAAYVVSSMDNGTYRLSSLGLKTGKANWSVEEEGLGIHEGGPVVSGGRVYVISQSGKVKAYEAATGKVVWEMSYSPNGSKCPTAISVADGVVYFGGGEVAYARSQGRFLWALDAGTGKVLWKYAADPEGYSRDGECVTAPAVSGGAVVTTSANVLYALDAKTGAPRWKTAVRRMVKGESKPQELSETVVAGGTVYSATAGGLSGWDLRSGRQVFDLPGKFGVDAGSNRMAAAGGVLYFIADMEGEQAELRWPLYALDLSTKQILWKHRTNRPSRYDSEAQWRTRWLLPADGAVYYENQLILVKLQ